MILLLLFRNLPLHNVTQYHLGRTASALGSRTGTSQQASHQVLTEGRTSRPLLEALQPAVSLCLLPRCWLWQKGQQKASTDHVLGISPL